MAEDDDKSQKTEHPTGRRLGEARGKGQLPISREAASWVIFIGILINVAWLLPAMANKLFANLRMFIEMPNEIGMNDSALQAVLSDTMFNVAMATGLTFMTMASVAILGTMFQTGLFYSLELIMPDFSRLLPIQGFKRIFSTGAMVEFFKGFGKLFILGPVVYYCVRPITKELSVISDRPLVSSLAFLESQSIHLITMLLVAFGLIAIADYYYQNYKYIENLKMSKTEVKDEHKQSEGDPAVKGRLRQIRLEKARKRMMAQVPKADVVITNPTHYAVAMQYDNTKMAAPTVIAKGTNLIAEKIKEIAEECKIPMVSNPPLARALHDSVEIDQQIPAQHYRAVAEIISYVYKLKKRKF